MRLAKGFRPAAANFQLSAMKSVKFSSRSAPRRPLSMLPILAALLLVPFLAAARSQTTRPSALADGGRSKPAQKPAEPPNGPSASPLDYSRLLRVWDINSGDRPGDDPYTRVRGQGDRMLLSASSAQPADLSILSSAGFTLIQTDSDHLSTEEAAPGVWNYARADADRKAAADIGLDWCYFPHFAFPPPWYRDRNNFTRLQCLEHNRPMQAYSPWDPKWAAFVSIGYQHLTEHFNTQRPNDQTTQRPSPKSHPPQSALYLGIHGDYGECGFPMGARIAVAGQREAWQRRFGDLHDHVGWWCADPLARKSFRESMLRKYRGIEGVNASWNSKFKSADQIVVPESPAGIARRYWLDFITWYLECGSGMADTVCRAARKSFPDSLLMIPAGYGDENPRGGNDNSAIPKIARRHRADVRSTHGAFKPFAQNQATMFGRLVSACRYYGVSFWSEPPGKTTADQVVERIFASVSAGSKGYFDWADNVNDNREAYIKYGKYLKVEKPVVDVAMLFPTTSHLMRPDMGYPQTFEKGCTDIRDVLDYDIVDERMIMDGALERCRVLVMWEGAVVEADTLARIRDWVQAGGVLAAYDFGKIETVEGDRSWFNDLFGYAGRLAPAKPAYRYIPANGEPLPQAYRDDTASPAGSRFLTGDWFPAEMVNGVAGRWTGAYAEMTLPVDPNRPLTITMTASSPPEAAQLRREVLVNGVRVGLLDKPGDYRYTFAVPRAAFRDQDSISVTLRSQTFTPSETITGSTDKRALGAWVSVVEVRQSGSGAGPAPLPLAGRLSPVIDLAKLRGEWARRFGTGWTVYYPSTRRALNSYYEVVRYLTYHLSDLDNSKKDTLAVDDAWDGIYATLFTDKALYYNPGPASVTRTIVLSPDAFKANPDLVPPAAFTHTLSLDGNAITPLYFDAPPQEMLLSCEKFLDLGTLKPISGATFHPGQGLNHVLIPIGGQISTRFEISFPGDYRVFYRAVRRGDQARVEITIDGRTLNPPIPASGVQRQRLNAQHAGPSRADTYLAGAVRLATGTHTLTLKPLSGQDVRADFVVLAGDRTIGGYRFVPR